MSVLKAIIVDDEEFARSSLFFLLRQNCPEMEIHGIAHSVSDARQILSNHKIDVVFLDIAMPGENGFGLIPEIQKHGAAVIFTTAYDQYALKAIKANALDYLLKPIDIDELKIAVDKVIKHLNLYKGDTVLNNNLEKLGQALTDKSEIKKITLPYGSNYKIIDINDIIHIEADSNYSIFNLSNTEKITVSKVLREYEEILPPEQFVRVHKSSIINLNYLLEYNSKNTLQLILKNGDTVTVSRRRASDFFSKIKAFINGDK